VFLLTMKPWLPRQEKLVGAGCQLTFKGMRPTEVLEVGRLRPSHVVWPTKALMVYPGGKLDLESAPPRPLLARLPWGASFSPQWIPLRRRRAWLPHSP
jgi:hypothetical protein